MIMNMSTIYEFRSIPEKYICNMFIIPHSCGWKQISLYLLYSSAFRKKCLYTSTHTPWHNTHPTCPTSHGAYLSSRSTVHTPTHPIPLLAWSPISPGLFLCLPNLARRIPDWRVVRIVAVESHARSAGINHRSNCLEMAYVYQRTSLDFNENQPKEGIITKQYCISQGWLFSQIWRSYQPEKC